MSIHILQAKEEILHTIQAYTAKDAQGRYHIPAVRQRPVLLIGPPGIGKTAIVEQSARESALPLVSYTMTHHTRQSAVGLPMISHETRQGKEITVTRYTMSEIVGAVYEAMDTYHCREGILFLDEINCVSETLLPTMLQLLQNKKFGEYTIPEGWLIVCAGNPREYNSSVRELDMVTMDRVKKLVIEPDYTVWAEYARQKGIHEAILFYLDLHREDFYHVEGEGEDRQFVTARGWEDLSVILKEYEALDIPITRYLIEEYLQCEAIAESFYRHFSLYQAYGDRLQPEVLWKHPRDHETEIFHLGQLSLPEQILSARYFAARLAERFTAVGTHRRQLEKTGSRLQSCFPKKDVLSEEDFTEGARRYETMLDNDNRLLASARSLSLQSERKLAEEEALLHYQKDCLQKLREMKSGENAGNLPFPWLLQEKSRLWDEETTLKEQAEYWLYLLKTAYGQAPAFDLFLNILLSCQDVTDFFLIHPSREYLQCLSSRRAEDKLQELHTLLNTSK